MLTIRFGKKFIFGELRLIAFRFFPIRYSFRLRRHRGYCFPYRRIKRHWRFQLRTREDLCQGNCQTLSSFPTPQSRRSFNIRRHSQESNQVWSLQTFQLSLYDDQPHSIPEQLWPKSCRCCTNRILALLCQDSVLHPSRSRRRCWRTADVEKLQSPEKNENQATQA